MFLSATEISTSLPNLRRKKILKTKHATEDALPISVTFSVRSALACDSSVCTCYPNEVWRGILAYLPHNVFSDCFASIDKFCFHIFAVADQETP